MLLDLLTESKLDKDTILLFFLLGICFVTSHKLDIALLSVDTDA